MNKHFKKKRVTVQLPLDFEPMVSFGSNVEAGAVLGKGSSETTLEYYPIPARAKILVDDGVYVSTGDVLIEKTKGIDTIHIVADNDGIVRIDGPVLRIIDLEVDSTIRAPVSGRVVLLNKTEIVIETRFIVIPMFISEGQYIKGDFVRVLNVGKMITSKDIVSLPKADVAILGGALTHKTFWKLANKGITSIIAPSIDWDDYVKIFESIRGGINLGILQGLGLIELWDSYKYIISNAPGSYIEVDFKKGEIYIPSYDIMSNIAELIVFKDSSIWATKIKELEPLEGNVCVARKLGESYMVNLDETQTS